MKYYEGQPFNKNLLRPCPMLENPEALERMVEESGAKCTDYTEQESAQHLCSKCRKFADEWADVAEKIWNDDNDPRAPYREDPMRSMSDTDKTKFARLNRTL